MKTITAIFMFLMFLPGFGLKAQTETTPKEELTWYTDMVKANEISTATGKPIFAFFTGSDWCGWCHKLQAEVFAKPEFVAWAKKNVILVELDFPRRKTLSPELTQQNNSLQQTFQVRAYPTVWMFFLTKNAEGNKFDIHALGSLGYPDGAIPGKEQLKFIENADSILSRKN